MKIARVDPALRRTARFFPRLPIGSALGRRIIRALTGRARPADIAGVSVEAVAAGGARVRVHRPDVRRGDGALLWIHGGGYLLGTAMQDDRTCAETAAALGIVVAAASYRLAPEHAFPLPLDDCLAAWDWLQAEAATLGVDPRRVAIGGQSAGGGLAAALVQRLHDRGGVQPKAQWLFCPMLDDRTAADLARDATDHFIWNNRANRLGWRAYLGSEPGAADLPPYAVPARRMALAGLPPTWIGVGEIDLFFAEDRDYAARLTAAGVDATFVAVPGAPHGFETWAATKPIARRYLAAARDWLGIALTA